MSESKYRAYHFTVDPVIPGVEIIIAELGYAGFESFVETENGVTAYIQIGEWNSDILKDIQILSSADFIITYTSEEIVQTNWNEEWERNFDPIIVEDRCIIRAPFHQPIKVEYDIIIEPKMSFGTGHHETTHMMIQHLLKYDLKGKSGFKSGILNITKTRFYNI